MNDMEIFDLLEKNCGKDENLKNFVKDLSDFELYDYKNHWKAKYNSLIEEYYDKEESE